MTICQKDGYWKDEHKSCDDPRNANYCKEASWSAIGADQMGFALFEPTQFSNSIWDHIGKYFWSTLMMRASSGFDVEYIILYDSYMTLKCILRMG